MKINTDNPAESVQARSMILMHNSSEMSRPWYEQLERGVREDDIPFRLTHEQDLFTYMDGNPKFDTLFQAPWTA